MNLLLIEPDKRLAATYRAYLEENGYAVGWAAHAQDAVIQADTTTPDLVLLELQLAAHNGVEFLYEFRSYAEWQAVPVVLLTTIGPHALGLTPAVMERLGIERCLYKPATTLKQLLRTVREVGGARV
jgi:DNA-binding response OmpR family regulator